MYMNPRYSRFRDYICETIRMTCRFIDIIFDIFRYFKQLKNKFNKPIIIIDIPILIPFVDWGGIQMSNPMVIHDTSMISFDIGFTDVQPPNTSPKLFTDRLEILCEFIDKKFWYLYKGNRVGTRACYSSRTLYSIK